MFTSVGLSNVLGWRGTGFGDAMMHLLAPSGYGPLLLGWTLGFACLGFAVGRVVRYLSGR